MTGWEYKCGFANTRRISRTIMFWLKSDLINKSSIFTTPNHHQPFFRLRRSPVCITRKSIRTCYQSSYRVFSVALPAPSIEEAYKSAVQVNLGDRYVRCMPYSSCFGRVSSRTKFLSFQVFQGCPDRKITAGPIPSTFLRDFSTRASS